MIIKNSMIFENTLAKGCTGYQAFFSIAGIQMNSLAPNAYSVSDQIFHWISDIWPDKWLNIWYPAG